MKEKNRVKAKAQPQQIEHDPISEPPKKAKTEKTVNMDQDSIW